MFSLPPEFVPSALNVISFAMCDLFHSNFMLLVSRFLGADERERIKSRTTLLRCDVILRYTKTHEWIKTEGDTVTIGTALKAVFHDLARLKLMKDG